MSRWMQGLVALFAIATVAGCSSPPPVVTQPQPPEGEVWLSPEQAGHLKLEVVTTREIQDTFAVAGKVAFDDLLVSHVFSPVNGRILKVLAQPGDRVKKGAPLVVIASPDLGSSFSDLAKAQADLTAAEHEYQRQKELYEAHAGSQRDFEGAEDNYKKARAEFQRAQQKARLLSAGSLDGVSQEYTLRAPIDGEVIARNVNPGVEVLGQYSGGTAVELFTIGELDRVFVYGDVHEMELPQVQKGSVITVRVVSYPDKVFEGTVDWVSSALDPTMHTARVRCIIKNEGHLLKPEMYATVTLAVHGEKALALPKSALLHLGEQTVVYVSKGKTAQGLISFERRPVSVREDVSGDLLPAIHGLQEGEAVVVDGAILLSAAS